MSDETIDRYEPLTFTPGIVRDANRAGHYLPEAKRLLRAYLESRGNHHDLGSHLCQYSRTDDELWENEEYAEARRIVSGMMRLLVKEPFFDQDWR